MRLFDRASRVEDACIAGAESPIRLSLTETGAPTSQSVPCEQLLHIGENGWRRLRQSLDATKHLNGPDRAYIDTEPLSLFEEARVAVGGEERRL
jgi:hypothetical protein